MLYEVITDRSYRGTAVDPVKESQRIRENMALGRSLSEGEPPKIERRANVITSYSIHYTKLYE